MRRKIVRSRAGTTAFARDLFGKYKPESMAETRDVVVVIDVVQQQFRQLWEAHNIRSVPKKDTGLEVLCDRLARIKKELRKIAYTAADVEKFSLSLVEMQEEPAFNLMAGAFLNALVSTGRDMEYTLHTYHLRRLIDYIGLENRSKIIRVDGSVGKGAGTGMKGGFLEITGNATDWLGMQMKGGRIVVHGDVPGSNAGANMLGGVIIIHGNCGTNIGVNMLDGRISIKGEYESIGLVQRGKIYHKGKLILCRYGEQK